MNIFSHFARMHNRSFHIYTEKKSPLDEGQQVGVNNRREVHNVQKHKE